jgi:hypothetical protein
MLFDWIISSSIRSLQADALYITDPAALYAILVRDQNTFRESTEFAGYIHSLSMFYPVDGCFLTSLFGIIHRGDGVGSVWGSDLYITNYPLLLTKSCRK